MKKANAMSAVAAAAKQQRILIYGMNYAPEPIGVGKYSGELGAYLATIGFKVDVVTAIPHYPGWQLRDGYRNRYLRQRLAGATVTHCPMLMVKEMHGLWRVIAPLSFAVTSAPVVLWQILFHRPDVVLCVEPTLFSVPIAQFAAWFRKVPTVLHVQDLEVDAAFGLHHLRGNLVKRFAFGVERLLLKSFDTVITISYSMMAKLREKGARPDRLAIIRNWVDLDQIKPLGRPSLYRNELGLSEGVFVALYAGNIGKKQSLHIVFEAAQKLAGQDNIVFVVAGEGPEKQSLMEQFRHLSNIIYLPVQPVERLGELLNLADVHLLPQARGAADLVLPSKLGGMLASGKPSIVLADPGTELHDFLGDGAVVLTPGDSALLANAIQTAFVHRLPHGCERNAARIEQLDARKNLKAFAAILSGKR